MLEFARYDGRKRIRGSVALAVGIGALVALYAWLWPSIETSGVDLEEYIEAFPPVLREMFGIRNLSTVEGYLAAELYAFVWVLLLGVYFAYAAASVVADDVERGRIDLLLSMPVSRVRLAAEKFAALLVPMVVVNVATPAFVYAGVVLVGESISVADLAMVHALSLPYFLACAGVGFVASVVVDRASVAQRVAGGLVFALFLVESIVSATDYGWLGAVAPARYYDPTAVLVDGTYDLAGAAILLAGTGVLVAAALAWFRVRDIE